MNKARAHTHRKTLSRYALRSAKLPRPVLAQLAKVVDEIAEEARSAAMSAIQRSTIKLQEEVDDDNMAHIKTLASVAEHALLPNFSILGDDRTLNIQTHDSGLFESSAELPAHIEEVTMHFGVADKQGEETVGEIAKTSMIFMGEIESAGLLKIRLTQQGDSSPVVDVLASSSDETWAVGVVGRVRNSLERYESHAWYLHTATFKILIEALTVAVFIVGLVMLKDRQQLQGIVSHIGVAGKAAIAVLATGAALILGHKLTTYARWLFPILEIDPVPADARMRHRRAVAWVLVYVFLPLVLNVILKMAS